MGRVISISKNIAQALYEMKEEVCLRSQTHLHSPPSKRTPSGG